MNDVVLRPPESQGHPEWHGQLAGLAPFGPNQLRWGGLLGGIGLAAVMAAMNWRRLGFPQRWWHPLRLGGIVYAAAAVLGELLSASLSADGAAHGRLVFLVSTVSGLFVAVVLSRQQRQEIRRWRADHEMSGLSPQADVGCGHLLRIYCLALLLIIAAWLPFSIVAYMPLTTLAYSLRGYHVFQAGRVSVTHSGAWYPRMTELLAIPSCQKHGTECLFAAEHADGSVAIAIIRFDDALRGLIGRISIGVFGRTAAVEMALTTPDAVIDAQSSLQINGHNVYRMVFRQNTTTSILYLFADGQHVVQLYAGGATAAVRAHEAEIDEIAQSVRISAP